MEKYKDKYFNKAFWKWFDSLDNKQKKQFWYHSADMSKLYFYNKYYVKNLVTSKNLYL